MQQKPQTYEPPQDLMTTRGSKFSRATRGATPMGRALLSPLLSCRVCNQSPMMLRCQRTARTRHQNHEEEKREAVNYSRPSMLNMEVLYDLLENKMRLFYISIIFIPSRGCHTHTHKTNVLRDPHGGRQANSHIRPSWPGRAPC
jgi:hypothetical protein